MTNALTLIEIFLINKNYLACEHLTIADISILTSVTLLEIAVEFDLTSYPNIWNWFNRLRNELPYYEQLTKVAHDELRAIIQSVRDVHEEWSTPSHQCAFTPNGSHNSNCTEEQKQQYQRSFLNANDHKDAERIMAAVSTVFRTSFSEKQSRNIFINPSLNTTSTGENLVNNNLFQPIVGKSIKRENLCSKNKSNSMIKRIRLTIEPNSGQSLQLNHIESSVID